MSSLKKTPYERSLLKDVKEARAKSLESGRECANLNCLEIGTKQPPENFYKRKGGKLDSYCIVCRKEVVSVRRDHIAYDPEFKTRPLKMKKWAPKKVSLNVGKAPWCKEHRTNSKNCGCATGRFFKGKKHRAKISESMRGKKNALGNHTKKGPMSSEHRLKIAMKLKEIWRNRKEAAVNGTGR